MNGMGRDEAAAVRRLLGEAAPVHPRRLDDLRTRAGRGRASRLTAVGGLAAITTLVVAVALATIASAVQENGVAVPEWAAPSVLRAASDDPGGPTVAKTFELKLYGDVPEEQLFKLELDDAVPGPGGSVVVFFCGDWEGADSDYAAAHKEVVVVSRGACRGGAGATYTFTARFARDQRITYSFDRANRDEHRDSEYFLTSYDLYPPLYGIIGPEDVEVQVRDTTTTAVYRFER